MRGGDEGKGKKRRGGRGRRERVGREGEREGMWRGPESGLPGAPAGSRQAWSLESVSLPSKYTCAKVLHDPPSSFVSAHAWLCAPKVFSRLVFFPFFRFLRFLQFATAKAPRSILMQNMPKHAVPRKDVPFWGCDHKI